MQGKRSLAVLFLVWLGMISWPQLALSFPEDWSRRFNGRGNLGDAPAAVATDSFGNAYVTGQSARADGGTDVALMKYDNNGKRLWVRYHSGSPCGLRVDRYANVYVAGTDGADYLMIKYDTDGALQWAKTYHGPPSDPHVAADIRLDANQNVIVTGSTTVERSGVYPIAEILTVKFDSAGNKLWEREFARDDVTGAPVDVNPKAMTVDGTGNIYIVADSYDLDEINPGYGWMDCAVTLKYDANGNKVYDTFYAVYAVAYPNIDFEGCGVNAIAVDNNGNAYLAGWYGTNCHQSSYREKESGYLIVKYSPSGAWLWDGSFKTEDWSQGAQAIALDDNGGVFVTGKERLVSATNDDFLTVKIANGYWKKRYNGPANSDDWAQALFVDQAGDVYVTGSSFGAGDTIEFATVKYAGGNGKQLWVRRYRNSSGNAEPQAISVNRLGNVFVVGTCMGSAGNSDFVTWKYTQWVKNPANGHLYKAIGPNKWTTLETIAQLEGGHLATIRSAAEQSWLVSKFGGSELLYHGLHDSGHPGDWQWTSGEPVTYLNWAAGEPSAGDEHCAVMNWGSSGWWNNVHLNDLHRSLIEKGD